MYSHRFYIQRILNLVHCVEGNTTSIPIWYIVIYILWILYFLSFPSNFKIWIRSNNWKFCVRLSYIYLAMKHNIWSYISKYAIKLEKLYCFISNSISFSLGLLGFILELKKHSQTKIILIPGEFSGAFRNNSILFHINKIINTTYKHL